MLRFVVRRAVYGLVVMWLVTTSVFLLVFAAPADPAAKLAGRQATPQAVEIVRERLGLNDPLYEQYFRFLGGLLRGDLGYSYYSNQEVTEYIATLLPRTASLVLGAAVLWLVVGLSIGVFSATHPRGLLDRGATAFVLIGLSMPTFLVGLMLLFVLFFKLNTEFGVGFFPPPGYVSIESGGVGEWARHLLLPWITLAFVQQAIYVRLTRSSMLEVLGEDYIRTARAKGLPERQVVYRHGLRAGMTPVLTQFGVDVGQLMGGVLLTETVFGLQGMGQAAVSAVNNGDLPVIMGVVIVVSLFIVVANLLVDVLYGVVDPRVRVS